MIKLLSVPYFFNRKKKFVSHCKYLRHKTPFYPLIRNFFNFRFFSGFYLLGLYKMFGCLKHWSIGMVCRYVFPKYSKKNIQTIFRLCGLFGTAIIDRLNLLPETEKLFVNKTVFTEFVVNSSSMKQKTWGRLNKVKRSLPRRSRKKIFISKMGRIWLT